MSEVGTELTALCVPVTTTLHSPAHAGAGVPKTRHQKARPSENLHARSSSSTFPHPKPLASLHHALPEIPVHVRNHPSPTAPTFPARAPPLPLPSPCLEENPTSSISLGGPPSLSIWALSCSASTLNYSLSLATCPQACPSRTGQLVFPKLLSEA